MGTTAMTRADRMRNPAAVTIDIAKEAGLTLGVDYAVGDPFQDGGRQFFTAKLLGDPVALTIRVIDTIGFYTKQNNQRWEYIGMPRFSWDVLSPAGKRDVVGFMYQHEGGVTMRDLFPNYGKP